MTLSEFVASVIETVLELTVQVFRMKSANKQSCDRLSQPGCNE